jgi:hypothetical protein
VPPLLGLLGGLGLGSLRIAVEEDHRAVLGADIGALPVDLGRVVDLPVDPQEIPERDPLRVEGHLTDLGVAGGARADLLVSRVSDVAALVADGGVEDALDLAEGSLDLPEAAGAEADLLGRRRLVGRAVIGLRHLASSLLVRLLRR